MLGLIYSWPSLDSPEILCAPINVFTIAFAVIVEAAHENEPRLAVPSCHGMI